MLRRTSLTAWLSLMFAFVAVITFAGVGTYLYDSLAKQIQKRDDAELIGRLDLVRHLLSETPSIQAIQDDSHPFIDASAGRQGFMVMLKSADGRILLQNEIDFGSLPELNAAPAEMHFDDRYLTTATLESGTTARIAAAWTRLQNPKVQVQAIVARTGSERQVILSGYRNQVMAASIAGALIAAGLGYVLVRRGFAGVRLIARQAEKITAQRLEMRLDPGAAPSELTAIVEAFNAMLIRLQDSFLRLSQFSADLAHDMRTPINNLMVQTQVVLSKSRSLEDYQALLSSNIEEYERLARMLDNMLFLARADDARVTLSLKSLDAREEMQRIADYFEGVAAESDAAIVVEGDGMLQADPILLRRAVSNLVANAIRHTPSHGIIRLTCTPAPGTMIVAVANNGPAIPKEHQPRLFDRFYRVDPSRSESAGSSGLGLAIVQKIMELHGGSASVISPTESGDTAFQLVFPALQSPPSGSKRSPTHKYGSARDKEPLPNHEKVN